MSVLQSVLREKRLRRTQQLQELASARAQCEASEQWLAACRRAHSEARAALWQTMTAMELSVQRLLIGRAHESHAQHAEQEASRAHAANIDRLSEAQQVLARTEKHIEKLQERWQLLCDLAALEGRKSEWRELDEWALRPQGRVHD